MAGWSMPKLPDAEPVRYKRNLLQKVVCELKFPTVHGLDRQRPPASLANSLRKSYPEHTVAKDVNVSATGIAEEFAFLFTDKKSRTTASLRSSAIAIEANAYVSFEDFSSRVLALVASARQVIDSEFFTRIGLRYINVLPYQAEEMSSWVNPLLIGPLSAGIFGDLQEASGRIAAQNEEGGFAFAYGIALNSTIARREYVLDLDFFRHDVELRAVEAVLHDLHEQEVKMFTWALGPAALAHMGPATPKKGKLDAG